MKGKIVITAIENLEEKRTDLTMETSLDCKGYERFIVIKELLRALKFTPKNEQMLALALLTNIWPQNRFTSEAQRAEMDMGEIKKAMEGINHE